MEFEHRGQQIKDALFSRRNLPRARRSRNTRYSKARFLNRKRPEGWLAPTLMHRVLTTETSVKRLCKFAPITEIRQELIKFDTQKIDQPAISGVEYQQGTLAGYEVVNNFWRSGVENVFIVVQRMCHYRLSTFTQESKEVPIEYPI
jgi:hypothetical protein